MKIRALRLSSTGLLFLFLRRRQESDGQVFLSSTPDGESSVQVPPPPPHPQSVADSKRKSRKLLRQQRTLQTGIHLCVKDPRVVTNDEADFEKKIEDPALPVPYLPNSIKSDGLQVKVLLSTL